MTFNRRTLAVLGLVALLVLAGCSGVAGNDSDVSQGVDRFVDEEAGVVCYTYAGNSGIDCVPINETRLPANYSDEGDS